ncbi:MAG: efflux transporter outer membrane subunit [Rhodoferax sp.]|nr:efflux transporter outer membrane subunit [Rhodoferax sp.]
MRLSELLIIGCASLTLVGCALPRVDADAPPPLASTAPPQWQAPLPHNGTLSDLTRWWQDLGDPLLVELLDAAQQASPSLASAHARVVQSRAALRQARAAQGPSLDGSASAARSDTIVGSPPTTTLQAGLAASWEIDVFGANRLASEAAQARLDRAEAAWHDARVLVAAEVASRYFNQRACEQKRRIAQADSVSRQETARLSDLTFKAGFTPSGTAALARAAASDANGRALRQGALCSLGVKALVALTGLPEATLAQRLEQAAPALAPDARLVVASLPADTLAQRPDLFAAQRDIAAARAELGGAQAQRYPRIALSGSIGALHYNAAGSSGEMATWSIGPLALSVPLFDGGRREAGVTAAQARYEESVALYRAQVRQAVREVEQALVTLQSTQARVADATTAEAGYRAWQDATEARYQGGLASLAELEDVRRTRLAAADALVALRLERIQAWIDLYRAAGGGWTRPAATPGQP